jgi:hypothetical protein
MKPKTRPDVILYKGNYPGWPWLARTRKGRLVCVFRDDGVHMFSPTGKILFTFSQDSGTTWAPTRVVIDHGDVDDRNSGIVELPDGVLLVCYNTYTEKGVSQSRVIRSADGGETWKDDRPISEKDTRTRSGPVALSTGDILVPYYVAPGSGSLAGISGDGGKTWTTVRVPDVPGFIGDEWDVLEAAPKRLVGLIRNSHPSTHGVIWKTESRDGGRSWVKPVPTNVRDARSTSPPNLGIHDRRAVLTYCDRRMVSVSMVLPIDDDYVLWDVDGQLGCFQYNPDGAPIADGGYPVSVQIGERRRFAIDYEIRAQDHQIAGYVVELPAGWLGA